MRENNGLQIQILSAVGLQIRLSRYPHTFPYWERFIPTLGNNYSHGGNKFLAEGLGYRSLMTGYWMTKAGYSKIMTSYWKNPSSPPFTLTKSLFMGSSGISSPPSSLPYSPPSSPPFRIQWFIRCFVFKNVPKLFWKKLAYFIIFLYLCIVLRNISANMPWEARNTPRKKNKGVSLT